jgi:hypothetical protein
LRSWGKFDEETHGKTITSKDGGHHPRPPASLRIAEAGFPSAFSVVSVAPAKISEDSCNPWRQFFGCRIAHSGVPLFAPLCGLEQFEKVFDEV